MGGYNGASYSNPEMDKKLEDSASIVDRDKRAKALQEINRMSLEDASTIPLHYQQDMYAVIKGKNIKFTPRPDRWITVKEIQ